MNPRLTIVIPTFNRPELLPRALDSALGQTVPARVILADDGDTDWTAAILADRYRIPVSGGQITHLKTNALDAWSNWRAGAEAADTEYVAWLQDDDKVCRTYAERILYAFDRAEQLGARPSVWMARLDPSEAGGRLGSWYLGNGPWVPMQTLHGECEPGHWAVGTPIAASGYFASWSISPALAYRNGPEFRAALATMPANCDMYAERIIPAEMARHGGFIADPAVVGYWVWHDDNLGRKQHPDNPRQLGLLYRHLDGFLDGLNDAWQAPFSAWCGVVPAVILIGWLAQLDGNKQAGARSRYVDTIRRLMLQSIEDRVKRVQGPDERPRWRKAFDRFRRGQATA